MSKARAPRHAGPRAIGHCLAAVAGRGVRQRAFQNAQLAARWAEIVGPELARHCAPAGLAGARGAPGGGVLDIATTSAFAPRLAMLTAELVERVNRFLGAARVSRVRIRHGFVPPAPAPPAPDTAGAPSRAPGPAASAPSALRAIADPGLRDALARLAARLDSSEGPPVFDAARSSR